MNYIFISVILLSKVLLYRNNWVYKNRIALIKQDLGTYNKLESYYQMVFKFWIWDINKFIVKD